MEVICQFIFWSWSGAVPFLFQYWTTLSSRNTKGFSPFVLSLAIFSTVYQFSYWNFVPYGISILALNFGLLLSSFILLELILWTKKKKNEIPQKINIFESKLDDFWAWTNLSDYLLCSILFFSSSLLFNYMFSNYIGSHLFILDLIIPLPQVICNFHNKSTEGVSKMMIALWAIADVFKASFYTGQNYSVFLLIYIYIELFLDFILIMQFVAYPSEITFIPNSNSNSNSNPKPVILN